jgi:hypothetical protein
MEDSEERKFWHISRLCSSMAEIRLKMVRHPVDHMGEDNW